MLKSGMLLLVKLCLGLASPLVVRGVACGEGVSCSCSVTSKDGTTPERCKLVADVREQRFFSFQLHDLKVNGGVQ